MELIKNMKVLEQLDSNCYRILIQNKQAQLDVYSKRFILASKTYQQFRKWIEIQYHINHPNIQRLYFYAHDNEYVYVVREYMCKGSLKNKIKYGDLDDQTLKSISQQLLNVQQYLDQNYLYLELKIENIFFDENNQLKISNLEQIEHKVAKLNNKVQIGKILYECIFKRSCRYDFEIEGDIVIKRPQFIFTKEISEQQRQLLSEFII